VPCIPASQRHTRCTSPWCWPRLSAVRSLGFRKSGSYM
jgi:hypothetical protein